MKAKRCKLCGGEPKYVHYAIPEQDYPDGWYDSEYGREPMVLFKRLECSKCGATVAQLVMTVDEAVKYWNEQNILVRYGEEKVWDVEEGKKDERT